MIPLVLLIGGAFFLALWHAGIHIGAIGLALFGWSLAEGLVEMLQSRHDRQQAYRRWEEWQR